MDNCIFCKIVAKTLPSNIVYEDQDFFGFLDIHPITKGHVQLVPKIHYRWTYDIPNFGQFFEVGRKIGLAAQKAVNSDSISFFTFGFDVPHAHLWIVPRFLDDPHRGIGVDTKNTLSLTSEELLKIQTDIISNL